VLSTVIGAAAAAGLTPGTSYDYRVQVASFGGSAESDLQAPPKASTPKKPLKCRKGFKKKTVRGKAKCVKRHRAR
jgi:hypothetical protein